MASIEEQLVDSSRMIADMVIANIGTDPYLFDEAVKAMLKDKYPLSMRAARIVQEIGFKHPNLLRPHIEMLFDAISKSKIDGVKRCTLKLFAETPIFLTEDQLGILTDKCFNFLGDNSESIAVKAFAMDILMKIIQQYPELKPELVAVLESIMPETSTGLKNKCKQTLKVLGKINN